MVAAIAAHGVRRPGSTLARKPGRSPSRAMPYASREDMMPVSSAPLATATSAMKPNSRAGTPPAASTTSSSGPLEAASVFVSTAAVAAMPTST